MRWSVIVVLAAFWAASPLMGCAGECTSSPQGIGPQIYYCFSAPIPKAGFCESQAFGQGAIIDEPLNLAFCLVSAAAALAVLVLSPSAPVIFHVLYALIVSWGVFSALYHVGLQNGMYRMMDATLSFLQAFIVLMLVRALLVFRAYSKDSGITGHRIHGLFVICTIIFTIYPAAVHVAGESTADPWAAWLVFDLLWFVILALLGLIWVRRSRWPGVDAEKIGFSLVWKSVFSAASAYAAWSVDKFICSEGTPYLGYFFMHGWWHILMTLSLVSLSTLALYLTACETGRFPVVRRFPARGPLGVYWVDFKEKMNR